MDNLTVLDEFHKFVNEHEDPRIKDWYFMPSPIPTIALSIVFLILVKILIPTYMKNRKPYQFKNFIIFYNGFQVLYSILLVYGFLAGGWSSANFDGKCLKSGRGEYMLIATYFYFLSKFTEFFDTILFALRKKDQQITRLHLYHHGSMPLGAWLCVKYAPDSPMTFLGLINSFVHVVMYTYYMLSAMGPTVQKYLWWKKYITILQLVQFVMTLTHSVFTFKNGCGIPPALSMFNIAQSLAFFVMFFDFYLQSYKKRSNISKPAINGVGKVVGGIKTE